MQSAHEAMTSMLMQRKHEALQMDGKTAAAVDEKEVLWRVNFEEFIRRLRHQVENLLEISYLLI